MTHALNWAEAGDAATARNQAKPNRQNIGGSVCAMLVWTFFLAPYVDLVKSQMHPLFGF